MPETYICTEPFEVTTHGATHIIQEIIVKAPTGRMQSLFARLDAENNKFLKGLMLFQKELESFSGGNSADSEDDPGKAEESSEDEKIDQFIMQMKMSGFDPTDSYSILKDLICFKKGASKMVSSSGSDFEVQTGHWEDMPMKEVQRLLGFYMINFIGSLG